MIKILGRSEFALRKFCASLRIYAPKGAASAVPHTLRLQGGLEGLHRVEFLLGAEEFQKLDLDVLLKYQFLYHLQLNKFLVFGLAEGAARAAG